MQSESVSQVRTPIDRYSHRLTATPVDTHRTEGIASR
jgi:hypothetical protein